MCKNKLTKSISDGKQPKIKIMEYEMYPKCNSTKAREKMSFATSLQLIIYRAISGFLRWVVDLIHVTL